MGRAAVNASRKDDAGKGRPSLLPWDALNYVVGVLEFGARKYAPDAWRGVPDGERRYLDAAMRHLVSHLLGEKTDDESGLPHLAHCACSVLFALALSTSRSSR